MADELEVINFTNIDKEDFDGQWAGKANTIKTGETKPFPRFLAEHYAKHLTNKILIRQEKDFSDESLRKPLIERILGGVAVPMNAVPTIAPEAPKEPEFVEMPKEETPVEAPKPVKKTKTPIKKKAKRK